MIGTVSIFQSQSQIVNFHAIAGDGIQIQLPQPETLSFGTFLKGAETVTTITLMDEGAVCFEVTAPSQYDVTVWMDFPANLVSESDPLSTLPASFSFAYNNKAFPAKSCGNALTKSMAIEVPDGFSSATFPVSFRSSGQPLPPPTPDHVGYTGPTDSFFILIYGQAGPAANDIVSGLYTGDIVLNIQFSTTE
jgi:hypothetical protein